MTKKDEHLPIVVYHPSVRSQPILGPDKALRRLTKGHTHGILTCPEIDEVPRVTRWPPDQALS